jgi:hypothetical protein
MVGRKELPKIKRFLKLKQLMQEETGRPVQGYLLSYCFHPAVEEQAMALLRGENIIYIDANEICNFRLYFKANGLKSNY